MAYLKSVALIVVIGAHLSDESGKGRSCKGEKGTCTLQELFRGDSVSFVADGSRFLEVIRWVSCIITCTVIAGSGYGYCRES